MPYFLDFSVSDRIGLVKKEFIALVRKVFDKPQELKVMITAGKLSNEQGKAILTKLPQLAVSSDCVCCRKFDQQKLQLQPVERALEPLLDMACEVARAKNY